MRPLPLCSALALATAVFACDKQAPESAQRDDPGTAKTAQRKGDPESPSEGASRANAAAGAGPHFTKFPGEGAMAAEFVKTTMSEHKDRRVLVYVGASWCEPCQRFHDAVEAGELDDTFPDLELVEFDLDEHKPTLTAAGYESRLVPLFSVPNDEGKDQDLRIEGSIKGESAVSDNLVPRLENLLARSRK